MKLHRALALLLLVSCAEPAVPRGPGSSAESLSPSRRAAETDDAAPARGPYLRLLTFNVNYGLAGDAGTVDAIASHDADVIVLQETNSTWERAIRARLGATHPFVRFHEPERLLPGGSGVLSKLPILRETVVPSAVDWFPATVLVLETDEGPVQLVNVHLRPMVSDSGSWVSGYFTTSDYRVREIRAIERVLDPDLPTLWAGDFNEAETAAGITSLRSKGFTSALPEKDTHATTWRWTYGSIPLALRLDHVLYDRARFALVDVGVHEQGRSDHLPVTATLRMRRVE